MLCVKQLRSALSKKKDEIKLLTTEMRMLHIVSLLRNMPKSIFVLFEKNAKNINDAASDIENTFLFPLLNLLAIFQQLKLNCSSNLLIALGNHNVIVLQ